MGLHNFNWTKSGDRAARLTLLRLFICARSFSASTGSNKTHLRRITNRDKLIITLTIRNVALPFRDFSLFFPASFAVTIIGIDGSTSDTPKCINFFQVRRRHVTASMRNEGAYKNTFVEMRPNINYIFAPGNVMPVINYAALALSIDDLKLIWFSRRRFIAADMEMRKVWCFVWWGRHHRVHQHGDVNPGGSLTRMVAIIALFGWCFKMLEAVINAEKLFNN